MKIIRNLIITLLFLSSKLTVAAVVTVNFTGTLDHAVGSIGLQDPFPGIFYTGQRFIGSFTYKTGAPATTVRDNGNYSLYDGIITNYKIRFSKLYANFDNGSVYIINDKTTEPPPGSTKNPTIEDLFIASTRVESGAVTNIETNTIVPGYSMGSLRVVFGDSTGHLFNDSSLPTSFPDLYGGRFLLDFTYDSGNAIASIDGFLDRVTVVPLAPSFYFLVSGVITLLGVNFRKRIH